MNYKNFSYCDKNYFKENNKCIFEKCIMEKSIQFCNANNANIILLKYNISN